MKTVPELPIRSTPSLTTITVNVKGPTENDPTTLNNHPVESYVKRITNDLIRTRMAVPVTTGVSQLFLKIQLINPPKNDENSGRHLVTWELYDANQKVINRGQAIDDVFGIGLTQELVSRLVLHDIQPQLVNHQGPEHEFFLTEDGNALVELKTLECEGSDNKGGNDFAIIIGIEKYRDQKERAKFALVHTRLFSELFQKCYNIPKSNIKLLQNEFASKSDIMAAVDEWLPKVVQSEDSRVFVFFAGHGSVDPKDGSAYILPYDSDPRYLKTSGVSISKLGEILDTLKSKNVYLFADASFNFGVQEAGLRPVVVLKKEIPHHIRVVLAKDRSHKTGEFGLALLDLLQGYGDRDRNGILTDSEFLDFLKNSDLLQSYVDREKQTTKDLLENFRTKK